MNMTKTAELTPNVFGAVKCWILSNAMDSYGPSANLDAAWHAAYEAECQLFNVFFKQFTAEEHETYREFVKWLDDSRMWESDLTIAELFEIFVENL